MKSLRIQLPEEVLNFVYRHGFVAEEHRDIVNKAILEGEDCIDDTYKEKVAFANCFFDAFSKDIKERDDWTTDELLDLIDTWRRAE